MFTKNYYSGTCLCGHSWKDHHLSMVMNLKAIEATNEGSIPGCCLYYGCNESEGLDENKGVHCFGFVDKDNPDLNKINEWFGTKR